MKREPGLLILEDPTTGGLKEFPGLFFGAPWSLDQLKKDRGYGEVVFNTSMTGYQEILTDPSYFGQIVCMTVPHIGNTGVNLEDIESRKPWASGFVIQELCDSPSNWRSTQSLEQYLIDNGIPGLLNVDTRAITRHLRTQGAVRGVMLPKSQAGLAKDLLKSLPPFEGRDLIREVTTREAYVWDKNPNVKKNLRVVAVDYGVKWNLLRSLEDLGCEMHVVPATETAEEILKRKPDGVFLSNGPGDPSAASYAVQTVRTLLGQVPIFGVCMGHQILALALGGKTYKLKFGHRGGNQPVLVKGAGNVEISSHNHGYSVDGNSLPNPAHVTHINLNDRTVEGLAAPESKAFSVQYHPEACPGPHDSRGLFDQFIQLMRTNH